MNSYSLHEIFGEIDYRAQPRWGGKEKQPPARCFKYGPRLPWGIA